MKLTTKFNLVLVPVLLVSGAIASYFSYDILEKNAEKEIIDRANIMMESALAMRSYTVGEIRPLLALQMKRAFRPQACTSLRGDANLRESCGKRIRNIRIKRPP